MGICDEIMASIKAHIEVVKISLLEIGSKDNPSAVSVENLHLDLKGHIVGRRLLGGGTERESAERIGADMICALLKEAEAVRALIIREILPQ